MLAEGYYNLAVVLMQKGRNDEALVNYKKSMKLFPDNSIVLNNIGVTIGDLPLSFLGTPLEHGSLRH